MIALSQQRSAAPLSVSCNTCIGEAVDGLASFAISLHDWRCARSVFEASEERRAVEAREWSDMLNSSSALARVGDALLTARAADSDANAVKAERRTRALCRQSECPSIGVAAFCR